MLIRNKESAGMEMERPGRRRPWPWQLGVLVVLLIVPALALFKVSDEAYGLYVLAWLLGISLVTASAYWLDKYRARKEQRRISERTLHLLEFLGGWPAAFLMQRLIRHKIRKFKYQVVFWLIILVHQLVLSDYLLDWQWARSIKLIFN